MTRRDGAGPELRVDPDEVAGMLHDLSRHGAIGGNGAAAGVRRLVYGEAWRSAMALCRRWATAAGLEVRSDAVGNLWARLPGRHGGPSLVTGSHIDSQFSGGRFDGALGAIGGILALKTIREQAGTPARDLEAVILCEEEGSRFPTAGFWGSRAITGRIRAGDAETTVDRDGIAIAAAMRECGLDPDRIPEARRDDLDTFLELHVEQGPVCEQAGVPVAVVEAITGIAQFEIVLTGEQNHAGACPMDLRRDPMAGFAEIASRLLDHAHRSGRPAVTTIGRCEVEPGGAAVIPERVRFTVDVRHPDEDARRALHDVHERAVHEVAGRRGLSVVRRQLIDHAACRSDAELVDALERAAGRCRIPCLRMTSGAGHDAQQMSAVARTAMVFVRSRGGLSHTPAEFSATADCTDGIRVLAETLRRLAGC